MNRRGRGILPGHGPAPLPFGVEDNRFSLPVAIRQGRGIAHVHEGAQVCALLRGVRVGGDLVAHVVGEQVQGRVDGLVVGRVRVRHEPLQLFTWHITA